MSLPKYVKASADGLLLSVSAKPTGRNSRILQVLEDRVVIELDAKPQDGEANAALVKYLAKSVGLHQKDISVISGQRSRDKTVLCKAVGDRVQTILNTLSNLTPD